MVVDVAAQRVVRRLRDLALGRHLLPALGGRPEAAGLLLLVQLLLLLQPDLGLLLLLLERQELLPLLDLLLALLVGLAGQPVAQLLDLLLLGLLLRLAAGLRDLEEGLALLPLP